MITTETANTPETSEDATTGTENVTAEITGTIDEATTATTHGVTAIKTESGTETILETGMPIEARARTATVIPPIAPPPAQLKNDLQNHQRTGSPILTTVR